MSLTEKLELERRLRLYAVLETARRALCAYASDPCDCKYGDITQATASSEVTGCCELRDLIRDWTGFSPFHRGQSVEDDVQRLREQVAA